MKKNSNKSYNSEYPVKVGEKHLHENDNKVKKVLYEKLENEISMDDLIKGIKVGVERYSIDFIENRLNNGMSKEDVIDFYENNIISFDLDEFVSDYLDDDLKKYLNEYIKVNGQETIDDLTCGMIEGRVKEKIEELTKEYVDEESLNIVQNNPFIEDHLEYMKEEKGEEFDLIWEVGEFIYLTLLSPSLEEVCDSLVMDWCERHKELIINRFN